ncbi:hypothetical protein ACFC6U_27015, partial [Kitasatospora purpeofusca]|uniref:hypothetical protein n=1 Tax=Kitasatospora purpeofusca TaxID=67352 RepID=UPI0035E2926B
PGESGRPHEWDRPAGSDVAGGAVRGALPRADRPAGVALVALVVGAAGRAVSCGGGRPAPP